MSTKCFLHSFFIFDVVPPRKEGADPVIYYYFSNNPDTTNNKNYRLTQVGLIITFISFCQRFSTDLPCDYVFTKVHEISMLELSGSIWMAVVLDSSRPKNRSLLNSVLLHFRTMFSSFFVPLKPLNSVPRVPNQEILNALPSAFPSILNSVDWNRFDFRYLFNSYIRQPMNNSEDIANVCKLFLQKNSKLFDNIAILYRKNKVVYSSFDPIVTRTLAFSIRHRFNHLFLHNPQRNTGKLIWLIGLFINNSGISSIYQQPIYFNGNPHLLVAFRDRSFKIVLTQPPDITVTEDMLLSIPKRLGVVRQQLDPKNLIFTKRNVPLPYATCANSSVTQQMTYECLNLDTASGYRVDSNFIKSHEFAVMYGQNVVIAAPTPKQFFIRCERKIVNREMEETILYMQPPPGDISHKLNISSFIVDQKPFKKESCLIA